MELFTAIYVEAYHYCIKIEVEIGRKPSIVPLQVYLEL